MNTENLTATSAGEIVSPMAVGEVSTDVVYIGETTSAILTPWMEEMESAVGGNTSAISSLNNRTATVENVVDSMETTVGSVADVCDALETQIGTIGTTVTTDSGRIDTLETVVDTMETTVGALTTDVAGLETTVESMDSRIAALENGGAGSGSGEVAPMCIASMHLGKLDNNSGAEVSSSTRICSEPIAVENGKSYWQVNDNAANFYVLLYDADEVFLQFLGSVASGAEFTINTEGAAYMRLGSMLGDYNLDNEIRIYNVDPASSGSNEGTAVDAYTKAESDERFAPIVHTHGEYLTESDAVDAFAAAGHTHTADQITGLPSSVDAYSKTEMDTMLAGKASATHTHTAADITGLPSSVDAYSKTEVDTMLSGKAESDHTHTGFAAADHTHSEYASASALSGKADAYHSHTYSEVGAAASNHSHTPASIGAAAASHTHDYAASNHTHSGYAASNHTHSNYASSSHTHHPANIGALSSSGGTINGALTVMNDSIFNGVLNTQKIQPKDSGSYSIGTADNRFYSTYLRTNPNVSSDRRLKRDIATIGADELAAFVGKLAVVSYNYNDDAVTEGKRIGLIAQDVMAADAELAKYFVEQSEKGFYSLRPADFVFPLIAAVQNLQKQIDELKK